MKIRVEVLQESEEWLAINKPAGYLSIPGRGNQKNQDIKTWAENRYGPVWIVHRLDQDTSGVMLLAKTAKMHQQLNQMFQERQVSKTYFALCNGRLTPAQGCLDQSISILKNVSKLDPKGKPSITHYQVIEVFNNEISWVQLNPQTGRMHQIRVHLAGQKTPILCDPIYGSSHPLYLSQIKKKYQASAQKAERSLIDRTALHAGKIEIPALGIDCSAPLAKDLAAALKQLQKWQSR